MINLKFMLPAVLVTLLVACSPKVGTEAWCKAMGNKAKLDWSASETAAYTKSCLLKK